MNDNLGKKVAVDLVRTLEISIDKWKHDYFDSVVNKELTGKDEQVRGIITEWYKVFVSSVKDDIPQFINDVNTKTFINMIGGNAGDEKTKKH